MPRHFKVHQLLSPDELKQFEAFARAEAARTVDQCHEWLLAHGFQINRSSVGTWKQAFDAEDKFRASNDVARSLMDAAKQEGGTAAISDAATLQLSQMLFEQLLRLQSGGELETKELWALSMAIKNNVQGARHIEKLREETEARQRSAIEQAEKEAKTGAAAGDVIATMKKALGITQ